MNQDSGSCIAYFSHQMFLETYFCVLFSRNIRVCDADAMLSQNQALPNSQFIILTSNLVIGSFAPLESVFRQTDIILMFLSLQHYCFHSQQSHNCIFPEMLLGLEVGNWQYRFPWISIPAPIHTWLQAGNVLEHLRDRLHVWKGLLYVYVCVCVPGTQAAVPVGISAGCRRPQPAGPVCMSAEEERLALCCSTVSQHAVCNNKCTTKHFWNFCTSIFRFSN